MPLRPPAALSRIPTLAWLAAGLWFLTATALAQTPHQPEVAPGPDEPDLDVVLETMYGLRVFDDLLNPVETTPQETPGLFLKVGPGPVTVEPVIALGLPTTIRGGWYEPTDDDTQAPRKHELFAYTFRNTTEDFESGRNLPPPLAEGSSTRFDPGNRPFGLWVYTDQFEDGVFTEPRMVAAHNPRLASQPYKAMIYPLQDKQTGRRIPNSYLVCWEYSTNDDFQDVIVRIDNVRLLAPNDEP